MPRRTPRGRGHDRIHDDCGAHLHRGGDRQAVSRRDRQAGREHRVEHFGITYRRLHERRIACASPREAGAALWAPAGSARVWSRSGAQAPARAYARSTCLASDDHDARTSRPNPDRGMVRGGCDASRRRGRRDRGRRLPQRGVADARRRLVGPRDRRHDGGRSHLARQVDAQRGLVFTVESSNWGNGLYVRLTRDAPARTRAVVLNRPLGATCAVPGDDVRQFAGR
jgi:hypothetical protein